MLEAEFTISWSQCGSQEFQEIFPVPAEGYRLYEDGKGKRGSRQLIASVYACTQCGHLEKFIDFDEEAALPEEGAAPPGGGGRPKGTPG